MDRTEVCQGIWKEAINFDFQWIEAIRNSSDSDAAHIALKAMIDCGITNEQVQAFAEFVRYEAAFATLRVLSEEACMSDDCDCLYEDLLTSRPS